MKIKPGSQLMTHYPNLFDLTGRVALVTGAGRGLGKAMALALADVGADIAILYNNNYKETQAEVMARGRRFLPIYLDLSTATPDQINAAVQRVIDEFVR